MDDMLDEAWTCLGGSPGAPATVRWTGGAGHLGAARTPVATLAQASVAAASLAGAELAAVRTGGPAPRVRVDGGAVATAFASERLVTLDGRPARGGWAPLSRFWHAADGWVRTHGNYPHHRDRLLRALGLEALSGAPGGRDRHGRPDGVDALVARTADAIAERTAEQVAAAVTAAGGLAVAVRGPDAWRAHEQGAAVGRLPWFRLARLGDGPPPVLGALPEGPLLPAAGLRVLDLTRVLAGPVATRTLALLGADVLRVDDPGLPEIPEQHLDTGMGKRSTLLDLRRPRDRAVFDGLLGSAHVVVTGYRPGALRAHGLDPEDLLRTRPSLIVATVSAWGATGPWRERRGFDSLVQTACGIAEIEAAPDGTPGALPVQGLDHSTGYLLAAAVLSAVARRETEGGGWHAELSLAQTAAALLRRRRTGDGTGTAPGNDLPNERPGGGDGDREWLTERDTPLGVLGYARTPVMFDGGPADWADASHPWGTDTPAWR